ncbi:NnrT protein [Phaeobacter sp. JH20_36]
MTARAGWSRLRIAVTLYPFGAGAMALNVYFAALITSWLGLPVLGISPSIIIGAVIALPATYAFAGHIRRLMDSAEVPQS